MIARKFHRRFAAHAVLALALLIAQLGAQVHAYSHLRAAPDSGGLAGSATQVCSQCMSFAPLLAAVGSADHACSFQLVAPEPAPCVAAVSFVDCFRHPAFRSRAPPRLV